MIQEAIPVCGWGGGFTEYRISYALALAEKSSKIPITGAEKTSFQNPTFSNLKIEPLSDERLDLSRRPSIPAVTAPLSQGLGCKSLS